MRSSVVPNHHLAAPELIGQAPLLAYLAGQLQPRSTTRVILLHGAPGAGKSAVIGALAQRWSADGGIVETVRLGELPGLGVSATSVGGAAREAPRLIVVDCGPAALPVSADVWHPLLGSLGPDDRLLVAARVAEDLPVDDARLLEVRVDALGWDDAHALLARDGVPAEGRDSLVRWAAGSPLHLVLGAQQWGRHPGFAPETDGIPADLASRLARRRRVAPPTDSTSAGAGPSLGSPARASAFAERPKAGASALDPAALRLAAEAAVRHFQHTDHLSVNPLATGFAASDRAESVRTLVQGAAAHAFSTTRSDAELREVLTAGYLVGSASHESLALDLHLSRSTYFRRLASALDRVAEQIVSDELERRDRTSAPEPLGPCRRDLVIVSQPHRYG